MGHPKYSGERRKDSRKWEKSPLGPGYVWSYKLDNGPLTLKLPDEGCYYRFERKHLKIYSLTSAEHVQESTWNDMKLIPHGSRKVTVTAQHGAKTSYYNPEWE